MLLASSDNCLLNRAANMILIKPNKSITKSLGSKQKSKIMSLAALQLYNSYHQAEAMTAYWQMTKMYNHNVNK